MKILVLHPAEIYREGLFTGLQETTLDIKHIVKIATLGELFAVIAHNKFDIIILGVDIDTVVKKKLVGKIKRRVRSAKIMLYADNIDILVISKLHRSGGVALIPAQTSLDGIADIIQNTFDRDFYLLPEHGKMIAEALAGSTIPARSTRFYNRTVLTRPKEQTPLEFSDLDKHLIQLVCRRRSNQEIATALNMTPSKVKIAKREIRHKIRCRTIPELIVFALRNELFTIDENEHST